MEANGALQQPITPEDSEMQKQYQEYLQKCCEVGQFMYQLEQLDGQKNDLEKSLELAQRAAKSAAAKHRDLQKQKFSKIKPAETPKLEMTETVTH